MEQKKLLYMSFIEAQFKHCRITWMFCSRSCNNKIYKSLNKPSPDNFFDSMFTLKRRQDPLQNDLLVPSIKTVTKGKDSAKYLGAVTWNSVPSHIRQQDSLEKFCDLIKKWKPDCKCKLCKDYIGHVGYIQIVE